MDGMRGIVKLFFVLLSLLYGVASFAADCPNVSVHPGITTIFLQTDFGEKDAASKAYVAGFEDAIKKSRAYCVVQDPRAALFALNLAGIDIAEDHERAALSLVIISEKGTLVSHFIRLSSIDNIEKNTQDDVIKVDRVIQRFNRHR